MHNGIPVPLKAELSCTDCHTPPTDYISHLGGPAAHGRGARLSHAGGDGGGEVLLNILRCHLTY